MSARVYVHPRCLAGPCFGVLQMNLEERGFDMARTLIGPPSAKGYCEVVRFVSEREGHMTMERLDGTQFEHKLQIEGGMRA